MKCICLCWNRYLIGCIHAWSVNYDSFAGWKWSVFQDQEEHSAAKTHERVLWSTVCRNELYCLPVWWSSVETGADSRWGVYLDSTFIKCITIFLKYLWSIFLFLMYNFSSHAAWDGRRRWNWCNVAPNWWCPYEMMLQIHSHIHGYMESECF